MKRTLLVACLVACSSEPNEATHDAGHEAPETDAAQSAGGSAAAESGPGADAPEVTESDAHTDDVVVGVVDSSVPDGARSEAASPFPSVCQDEDAGAVGCDRVLFAQTLEATVPLSSNSGTLYLGACLPGDSKDAHACIEQLSGDMTLEPIHPSTAWFLARHLGDGRQSSLHTTARVYQYDPTLGMQNLGFASAEPMPVNLNGATVSRFVFSVAEFSVSGDEATVTLSAEVRGCCR